MKKIIWVFGESGTGKFTLINNLINGDINTLSAFNMKDMKICASDVTLDNSNTDYSNVEDPYTYDDSKIEEDNRFFHKERMFVRRKGIMYDTKNFINSDNDILLIKGQTNDMYTTRGNIIGNFLEKYSKEKDVEISVYILQVPKTEELQRRLMNKSWYDKIDNQDIKRALLNVIPKRQEEHKSNVIKAFEGYGITVYTINSGYNSYTLKDVITTEKAKTI